MRVSAWEIQTRSCHHAVDPEMKGVQKLRAERVGLVQRKNLPPRVISGSFVVEFVWLPDPSTVKHVGARDRVRCRKFVYLRLSLAKMTIIFKITTLRTGL